MSPDYYARHLRHAVRFAAGVRTLAADPTALLLEVGPGNALSSLARMTVGKDANTRVFSSLSHPRDRRSDVEATLETTARMWLAGAAIDWAGLHADSAPRRIPLPTYPFDRKRHWVEAAPVAAAQPSASPLAPSANLDEWMFAPTWMRDDARPAKPSLAGTWLIFTTDDPLSADVVSAAREAGADVVAIEAGIQYEHRGASLYVARPANADDLSKVLNDLSTTGRHVAGAIDLRNTASRDESGLVASHHALVAAADVFAPLRGADDPLPFIVATVGAQTVLDEPVHFPARAAVLGPVLALPFEMPSIRLRAVDVELSKVARAAADIIAEASIRDLETIVARRAGKRWVRRLERIAIPTSDGNEQTLKPRGVYLVTGGLGAVGLTLAEWLARRTSARLLLTSRTVLPDRAEWDAWLAAHPETDRASSAILGVRRIEAAGGEVLVAAADAADERAMSDAINLARARWGSIDGVVHAAGVPGNGRIALLTSLEEVDAVITPKFGGLTVLTKLLGDTDLDFVVLLSSINSVLGAPGLADYGSANAMLDAFIESVERPARWRHVAAINYGPWRDIGMASRLFDKADNARAKNEEFRRGAIPPEQGAEAFGRILLSGRPQVVVARQDLPRLMELARMSASGVATPTAPAAESAAGIASTASADTATNGDGPAVSSNYEAPGSDDETRMASIWSELLGVERIGANDDFFELGGHSLLATRVLARIDQAMGVRLALRDVFDAPTLRTLAARVGAARPATMAATSGDDSDREELEF